MKKISIGLINLYQRFHPILHSIMITVFGFSITCKQKPSCSQYTVLQIQKHGTITGLTLGLRRFIHCF